MIQARKGMDTNTLPTYDTAKSLLRPACSTGITSAEDKRSWWREWIPASRDLDGGNVLNKLWDSVLMRTYDGMSGSPPDSQCRMLARNARMHLDTEEIR